MSNGLAKFTFIAALLAFGAAHAEDVTVDGFETPSGNVACLYSSDHGKNVLRCDIEQIAAEAPRPAECKQKWGHSFEMEAEGAAGPICTDDTAFDPGLENLPYGQAWQRGGFTCRSEQSGLTCTNAMQHGFSLSRGGQRLF